MINDGNSGKEVVIVGQADENGGMSASSMGAVDRGWIWFFYGI
jgi:hypothetical protein